MTGSVQIEKDKVEANLYTNSQVLMADNEAKAFTNEFVRRESNRVIRVHSYRGSLNLGVNL